MPWRSWRRVFGTASWMAPLSGWVTQGNSMPMPGADKPTPSSLGSPALPSPRPEDSSALPTPAGSGPRSFAWREDRGPRGSSWRMCPGFSTRTLDGRSVPYSAIWPPSGSMRSGRVWGRTTWVPATFGSGYSSSRMWPTPRAEEKGQRNSAGRHVALSKAAPMWRTPDASPDKTDFNGPSQDHPIQPTLASMATRWPSPTATDATGPHYDRRVSPGQRPRKRPVPNLAAVALRWQTPSVFGGTYRRQVGQTIRAEPLLPKQAERWATATSRDWKDGAMDPGSETRTNSLLGRQVLRIGPGGSGSSPGGRTSPRLRLNPQFTAWLMGLPPRWISPDEPTPYELSGMRSYLSRLRLLFESCTGDQRWEAPPRR